MNIAIEPCFEPDSSTWSYLLADADSGAAAIVDPVWVFDPVSGHTDTAHVDAILAAAAERDWTVHWVLETHAHADHLSAGDYVRRRTGARIAIGEGIRRVQRNFIRLFHLDDVNDDGAVFDRLLREGDTIELGELSIAVMETPGHTDDSITYLVDDAAFVGDTLFAPRYGTARCDFPGGDAGRLFDSIQRLHALPPETRLHLCHDYPPEGEDPIAVVTVAESRRENVHVHDGVTREAFVALREARDAGLDLPRLIYPSLQVNIRGGAAPPAESNGAAYLKLPFNTDPADLLDER